MAQALRNRHYSRRTEQAYIHWIRRFISFHAPNHPRQLREGDVDCFLTHLAVDENAAASTQNQALAAVLFLYEHVLEQPLDRIEGVVHARKPKRLPVVLARGEVEAILAQLDGAPRLVCMLLHESGMRLLEGLRQRSAFVCHPLVGGRLRHQDRVGAAGHKDVQTAMVYRHVLNRGDRGVRSPLDGLRQSRLWRER